jgi:NAD(P)-dependent dehydrogenase (short-subunit alcohol dehydrogenase family)
MSLPWKHAIVIGASSGMGEAIARRLASEGCRVALIARRADALETVAAEINAAAGEARAFAVPHDVRDRDSVPALFQDVATRLGGLDVIFYTAGVQPRITEDEYDTSKDELIMEVNTLGAMAWFNQAATRFERTGSGTIVGISSIAGDRGRRGNPAYCTSKAALATYLEALRNRLSRHGVKVVTIKPGFVATSLTEGLPNLLWLISADEAAAQIIEAAKKGRVVAYVPAQWRLVGMVVKSIPSVLFRRLSI